jgi:hypothetical protein
MQRARIHVYRLDKMVRSRVDDTEIAERPYVTGFGLEYGPESAFGAGVIPRRQRGDGFLKYRLWLIGSVKQAKADQTKTKS